MGSRIEARDALPRRMRSRSRWYRMKGEGSTARNSSPIPSLAFLVTVTPARLLSFKRFKKFATSHVFMAKRRQGYPRNGSRTQNNRNFTS